MCKFYFFTFFDIMHDDQDPIFNPVEKVIWEFEQKIGMPIENRCV
jgi:hypothetical protein